jgi:hypothetical protein
VRKPISGSLSAPALRGKEKALRKDFERHLERKVGARAVVNLIADRECGLPIQEQITTHFQNPI